MYINLFLKSSFIEMAPNMVLNIGTPDFTFSFIFCSIFVKFCPLQGRFYLIRPWWHLKFVLLTIYVLRLCWKNNFDTLNNDLHQLGNRILSNFYLKLNSCKRKKYCLQRKEVELE